MPVIGDTLVILLRSIRRVTTRMCSSSSTWIALAAVARATPAVEACAKTLPQWRSGTLLVAHLRSLNQGFGATVDSCYQTSIDSRYVNAGDNS